MAKERHLFGCPASPGFAAGPVVVLHDEPPPLPPAGPPIEEARSLRQAIAAALVEAKALADRAGSEAAKLLSFQVELLADDEMPAKALEAIARGAQAAAAWTASMGTEIDGYRTSGDEYFAVRAGDLQDIRDRVLAHLAAPARPGPAPRPAVPSGMVVVAEDLTLSRFLALDWTRGGAIVLTQGSAGGHVAMLAQARGVPMVVGIGGHPDALAARQALVDATAGEVVLNPGASARAQHRDRSATATPLADASQLWRRRHPLTADGTRIALQLDLVSLAQLDGLDPGIYDGFGLVRSEWLFDALPDEQTQYEAYRQIAEWADDRPVTIRSFACGIERLSPGVAVAAESNPLLGLRGVRLGLRHPQILRTQLRALARAAVYGTVRIALAMVTVPRELHAVRRMLDDAMSTLARDGLAARRPPLGIMLEVPAAALATERFDAEFFIINADELTQLMAGAGQDNAAVADLVDPRNPAVLQLIAAIARRGGDVGVCGAAAAEPDLIPHLLLAGVRALAVPPTSLARAKQAIAAVDLRKQALLF